MKKRQGFVGWAIVKVSAYICDEGNDVRSELTVHDCGERVVVRFFFLY